MAFQHTREAAVRPRFLVALILSTVTALAVAAPLAINALDNTETMTSTGAVPTAEASQTPSGRATTDLNNVLRQRTLTADTAPAVGGIGARARTKAQDQTHKAGSPPPTVPSSTVTSLLTNDTTVAVTPIDPPTDDTIPATTEATPPVTTPPTTAEAPATTAPGTTVDPATTATTALPAPPASADSGTDTTSN